MVFTSLFCGTGVAKEADMSVHMLFFKNIDMVNANEISVIESDKVQMEDNFQKDMIHSYEETVFVNAKGVTIKKQRAMPLKTA